MGRDRTRLERLEQLNQSGPVLSITGTVGEIDVMVGVNPVISLSVTFKTAGGDLSGTYPSPTVAKINGVTLGSTTATAANLLIASGAQWVSTAVTGDVTITSGGVTAIGAHKVTNAQRTQMAANTVKGNNTAGTADEADLTVAQINTLLGTVTGLAAVGATPNANGASISGNTLNLQAADGTRPGALTAIAQTVGGAKTFSSQILAPGVGSTGANDGTFGGTGTINFSTDWFHGFQLTTAVNCTVSFTAPTNTGNPLWLLVRAPAAGTSPTITWPATVKGSPPTTVTLAKVSLLQFMYDGATYYYMAGCLNV